MNSAVRTARPEDAAELARLSQQLGYPAEEATMRSRLELLLLDADHRVAVAARGSGGLSGWIHVACLLSLESGSRVEILGLVVDSSERRSGVGARLVQAAEHWAMARGVASVVVRSNVLRAASHSFYQALGYQLSKTQHVYAKRT